MKTIKFTDSEIAELKNYCQRELEKTLEKLETVKGILNKIDPGERKTEKNQETSKQPDTLKTDKSELTEPTYRNRTDRPKKKKVKASKSKWGTFMLDLLKQHGRPIKYNDIVEEAIFKFKIPKERYENVKQSITNSTFRLKNLNKKIQNYKLDGEKGKYLGLSRWFDKNGELKEKYKEKLTPTLTEKPKTQKSTKSSSGSGEKVTRKTETSSKTKAEKPSDSAVWTEFVLNTLKKEDRPVIARTLTEKAMETFNIDEKLYEKTRLAVARSMSRLEKENKKLKTYTLNGTRPWYYGLADWFDKNGELNKTHLDKIKSTVDATSA